MTWLSAFRDSIALRILAAILAAGIFAADSLTDQEIAASVLYVAVVLLSVRFCKKTGVLLVSLGCAGLTILSFSLTKTAFPEAGVINTAISLTAIGLTTLLALRTESARNTARRLAESEQLRDALIGSVSHELRTPLSAILGGISVLAEAPAVLQNQRLASLTGDIRDEAVRLNNDIQNLLDAARITSHGLRARRDWVEQSDILASTLNRVRARYPRHSFQLRTAHNLPLLHVDPVLIDQALSQIVANAAKFSRADLAIEIDVTAQDQKLLIAVRDKGVGLNAEERSQFARRFFRGSRHVGKIPGSGLGLWIAETFITSSGGTL
ncbi:MAG: hypothetical protein JO254_05145, partial [Pseudolabrys sp.]|nr:hypothetical protein [Pseudolabrys sp.]